MIHGWGQSKSDLRPLGHLLAKAATVHLVDLPGFGDSPLPATAWSTADYALALDAHLQARGIDSAILLGHSFGGRVAVQLAGLVPERVRGLVLVAAAGLPGKRSIFSLARARALRCLGLFLRWVEKLTRLPAHAWFVGRFGSSDYKQAEGVLRGILVKAVNENLGSVAARIRCPALLIWGEKDTATPLEMGRRYQAAISNSELVVLPAKDHFPHRGAGAHLCAYHILRWLPGVA
jgi:pimeloyl-ACP methyl ester carboxylesterase